MDLSNISDKLPTYPPSIQGDLRLILQTKDIFMASYRQLEEYRRLVDEQKSFITKEFVREQLQVGVDEIEELRIELAGVENRLKDRISHNEMLAQQLVNQRFDVIENNLPARHMIMIRGPSNCKKMLLQRRNCSESHSGTGCRSKTHFFDSIALALDEIHAEVRNKVKPLIDYYRDLFYLQLHFCIVLGQVCNCCMPLVTENIGFLERVFFWTERPEFGLIRRGSDISDRLKEIYGQAHQIYQILTDSVHFLQSKFALQKSLEERFHELIDKQQKTKDKMLRDIHNAKMSMDSLEEENDRLVGRLVKLDPSFVDSQNFAEHGIKTSVLPRKTINPTSIDLNTRGTVATTSYYNHGSSNMFSANSGKITKHNSAQKTNEETKTKMKRSKKRAQSTDTREPSGQNLSSEEEARSQTQSPKMNIYPTAFKTESESARPRSEQISSGEERSLKTRLLARTRGVLNSNKLQPRDCEDSSGSGALIKSEYPERGDSTGATFSPTRERKKTDLELRDLRGEQSYRGRTQSRQRKKNTMKGRSKYLLEEFHNLALKDEDMLLLKGVSRARRLKSRELGRQCNLTVYPTNSACESRSSMECQALPIP